MSDIIKFQFPEGSIRDEVEGDACLALFSSECLYGRPQTLLEASYLASSDGRSLALRVAGPAGETAARVFIGLCTERFGEAAFRVVRVAEAAE